MDPVIIVGAGLGGLLLALLLDQAPTPIPYTILERSAERKWPLVGGGVIFLTPQIHPLLARLGILDDLREISRPVAALTVYEVKYKAGLDPTKGAGAAGSSPQGKGSASGSVGSEPKMSGLEGGDDIDDDGVFVKSRYDYDTLAISRPELYNFLVDRVPEEKLVLGKQVQELVFQDIAHDERSAAPAPALPVSVPAGNNRNNEIGRGTEVEMEDGVQLAEGVGAERGGAMTTITMPLMDISGSTPTTTAIAAVVCADGSRYEGIIVGADGAYSTVRLSLYRHLREKGLMTTAAAADKEEVNEDRHHGPMRAQFRVLVGMTRELDPDRFELLKSEYSDVRVLVSKGDHPFAFWCVPMTGNKICWILEEKLAQEQICPEIEDFTQDQQAISQLCESVRSIPSSYKGVTVGEIILDSTPEGTAALIPREEGYFSTWTHGNVTLMGDACHKALPYTGQPITLAGQDAVKLANVLYAYSLDASLACSPPLPSSPSSNMTAGSDGTLMDPSISISSESSFPAAAAGCSHETKGRRGSDIEKRLRSYEAERRAEAEHAVRRAGRVSRLLLPLPLLSSFDVRDPESSYDEGKGERERERELQELFAGVAGL